MVITFESISTCDGQTDEQTDTTFIAKLRLITADRHKHRT